MALSLGLGLGLSFARGKGAGVPSAFGGLKQKLTHGNDAEIVVIGDSTGDQTFEWPYQWLEKNIGPRYPSLRIRYRLYDYLTNAWSASVTVQAGSGGTNGTLDLYNFSVGGTLPSYVTGARRSALVGLSPDIVIWNHGHNTEQSNASRVGGNFFTGWETLRLLFPLCPHAVIRQNPNQNNNNYAAAVDTYTAKAELYGDVTLIDVYGRFIAAGKPSAWYQDNVHPNAAGQAVFVEEVDSAYIASHASPRPVAPAFLATPAANLFANGDFSVWPGSVPTGWTAYNGAVTTADTVVVDADYGRTRSVKLTGNAANSRLSQALSGSAREQVSAAGAMTIAVRCFRPGGLPSTTGTVGTVVISPTAGTWSVTTGTLLLQDDGWTWVVLPFGGLPPDISFANVELYADTAGGAGGVLFDRVIVVPGVYPRAM